MTTDKSLPFLTARIKKKVSEFEGKEVVFTEIRGQSRTQFKGILTGVYDRLATISLDQDIHNYDTYAFNYSHLLMGEGTLRTWDKELDRDTFLEASNQ